ncbi:MAG: PKD domain-containing protein [Chitinophagales bacterium]
MCHEITLCNPLNTDYLYRKDALNYLFQNQITEATSFFRNFDDGTTTEIQNPVHAFSASGTYQVCLVETDACNSDTMCKDIIVCGSLTTTFSYAVTDLNVSFTDNSINATTWNWNFGDGENSTEQSPLHNYALPGIYEACLNTANGSTSDTLCETVTIIATGISSQTIDQQLQVTIFPNPFTSNTTIQFSLAENNDIKLELFDIRNQKIKNIATGKFEKGIHQPGITN